MANVNCYGSIISNRGATVPLLNTAQTEGTLEEVQTDSNFVGTAQTFGTFATQMHGQFVASVAGLVAENDVTFGYVQSAGKIKIALPLGGGTVANGASQGVPAPLPYPKVIQSGDSVQIMVNAATDRQAGVSVACSNGEYHCFEKTVSGSGEQELTSVLDGQSLGLTLQGRTITHWFGCAGANDAEMISPIYVVNGSGTPIGSVGWSPSHGAEAATFQRTGNIPVSLNSRLVFRTDA